MSNSFPFTAVEIISSFLEYSIYNPKYAVSNDKIKILLSKITRMKAYKSIYGVNILKLEKLVTDHNINSLSVIEHAQIVDTLIEEFKDCPLTCL
jgi:hypothetical protein